MDSSDKEGTAVPTNETVDTTLRINNLETSPELKTSLWSDDEHKKFLNGLNALGRGDWKGIATNFVKTRTPSQIASHAQKYFNRQSVMKRRRTSVFDIPPTSKVVLGSDTESSKSKRKALSDVNENTEQDINAAFASNSATEFKEQPMTSGTTKPKRYIPAVCWIPADDYSNESRDIHGFLEERLLDPENGSPVSTTNNNKKLVLRKTNPKTPESEVLDDKN